jgi:hypothetical protein
MIEMCQFEAQLKTPVEIVVGVWLVERGVGSERRKRLD